MSIITDNTDYEKLEKKLQKIKDKIVEGYKTATITCVRCGEEHIVGESEYIQTYWYEEPYGCSGGAEWYKGEIKFKCLRCGHVHRAYHHPELNKYVGCFKGFTEEYRD